MIIPLRDVIERNQWIYSYSERLICCDQKPRDFKIQRRAGPRVSSVTLGRMLDVTTENEASATAILRAAWQPLTIVENSWHMF